MTSPEAAFDLGRNILAMGKRLCPDRFPVADEHTAREWGHTLAEVNLPVQIWPEAVRYYALRMVENRMVTPRDLREAAHIVMERWGRDPEMKPQVTAWRERIRQQRHQRLFGNTPKSGLTGPQGNKHATGEPNTIPDQQPTS